VAAVEPKLRVGVFADTPRQPRWLVESIARVAAGDFAQICVLATSEHANGAPPALWNAYGRLDRWVFGGADPLKPKRVDLLVAPQLRAPLAPGDAAWRKRMASLDLDVAITLGDLDESGLESLARYDGQEAVVLSIVTAVVHRHGGTLRFDRAPIGGLRIDIALPA